MPIRANDEFDPADPVDSTERELPADPGDVDEQGPQDGRDSQSAAGSDEPELLDANDPLKDPQRAVSEQGTLLTETPLPDSENEPPLDR